jgi:predicted DNA-binding transcriptional regulator AlpA
MTTHQKVSAGTAPKHHHLDRRADGIVAVNVGAEDELLSTRQTADWLGVSTQWLEIGRGKNYGPKFMRVSSRVIRYRRGDVIKWLNTRSHASTAEYCRHAKAEA